MCHVFVKLVLNRRVCRSFVTGENFQAIISTITELSRVLVNFVAVSCLAFQTFDKKTAFKMFNIPPRGFYRYKTGLEMKQRPSLLF